MPEVLRKVARLVPDSTSRLTMVLWDLVSWELCQYGPEDHFQNRVASIPQRMQAVLKRQWSPTRYEQGGPDEVAVSLLGPTGCMFDLCDSVESNCNYRSWKQPIRSEVSSPCGT